MSKLFELQPGQFFTLPTDRKDRPTIWVCAEQMIGRTPAGHLTVCAPCEFQMMGGHQDVTLIEKPDTTPVNKEDGR